MKRYRRSVALALMLGVTGLGLWPGTRHQASAQGYGGGDMGTSTLSFDPPSLTVQQGDSASAKITVKLASGKTWGTNLKTVDVPSSVTVSFNPPSGDPPFTSTMIVKVLSSAKPGTYTIKVQATGDDPSAVTPYQVAVTKSSSGGY